MMTLAFELIPPEVAGSYTWEEKLEIIFTTAIGGFLLVFLVLAIIWLILEIFGKLISKNIPEAGSSHEEAPTPVGIPLTPVTPPVTTNTEANEEEIVAAIIAAISAHTGKPTSRFRVVSFRKKH